MWGFACPVIGEPRVWAEIAEAITDVEHHVFLVPGLVEASPTWQDALSGLDPTHVLHRAGGITRCRADLRDGIRTLVRAAKPPLPPNDAPPSPGCATTPAW